MTITGKGSYEGTAKATFKIALAKAAKPKTVAYPSKGRVAVSWKAVTGAKSYQVQWRKAGATTATVKGLKPGKTYYVRVRPYRIKSNATYVGVLSGWKVAKAKWQPASSARAEREGVSPFGFHSTSSSRGGQSSL